MFVIVRSCENHRKTSRLPDRTTNAPTRPIHLLTRATCCDLYLIPFFSTAQRCDPSRLQQWPWRWSLTKFFLSLFSRVGFHPFLHAHANAPYQPLNRSFICMRQKSYKEFLSIGQSTRLWLIARFISGGDTDKATTSIVQRQVMEFWWWGEVDRRQMCLQEEGIFKS